MKMKGMNNIRGVKVEQEHSNRHARAVAAASAAAAEAAAVAAQAAAEVIRLTQSGFASSYSASRPLSVDDLPLHGFLLASHAATLIQSAYRGHLARQALRALKGLVKLQAVVRGHLVRRQARISLRCMQALVRLQARVRARQVKAALMLEDQDKANEESGGTTNHPLSSHEYPSFQRTHNNKLHDMATRQRHLSIPAVPNTSARSPTKLMLHPSESIHSPYSHQHHLPYHNKSLDTFSRASSLIGSEDSRDWDSSALSKEELELKVLKKQHALAMRQKALSYAENHQRAPARSSGTPTRRMSSDYYQPQQQRFSRLSFNETEPEKLHRDWSWLEGWMAAHGATPVWESNAAALWESRDERRDRRDDEEEQYGYLYEEDEVEEEEENARASSNSLFHDHLNSDDDPAIKIIEMDHVATPTSSLGHHLHFPSPTLHQFPLSTRNNQHLTSHMNGHHHPLPHR